MLAYGKSLNDSIFP